MCRVLLCSFVVLFLLSLSCIHHVSATELTSRERELPLDLAEVVPMSVDELLSLSPISSLVVSPPSALSGHDEAFTEVQSEFNQITAPSHIITRAQKQREKQLRKRREAAEREHEAEESALVEASSTKNRKPRKMKSDKHRAKKKNKFVKNSARKFRNALKQNAGAAPAAPEAAVGESAIGFHGDGAHHGNNYWNWGASTRAPKPAPTSKGIASKLSQVDTRCVICQYVVQKTRTELTGYSFCPGEGITREKIEAQKKQRRDNMAAGEALAKAARESANKPRLPVPPPPPPAPAQNAPAPEVAPAEGAAEAPAEAPAEPSAETPAEAAAVEEEKAALFLEMETDADLAFMSGLSLNQMISSELESLADLSAAQQTWLAATDAAAEHSATEALDTYYPWDTPNLRNIHPNSYPPQLMDRGYEAPKRYRANGLLGYRPVIMRHGFQELDKVKDEQRKKNRETYKNLYTNVWLHFENLCSKRMPVAYVGYCKELMENYRYIAQGLHYGDRPDTICMNGNYCPSTSYIVDEPHMYYRRKAGDSNNY